MFEDFDEQQSTQEARGRMGVSVVLSAVIFALLMSGVAAAVATARVVAKRRQADFDVQFADLPRSIHPELKVDKPKALAKKGPAKRKAAKRRKLETITAIPDERPEEAEGELVEAGDVAPVAGFLDGEGEGGGEGEIEQKQAAPRVVVRPRFDTGPRQRRASVSRPRYLSGCSMPEIPETLHSQAVTIRVDVRMLIGVDGRVLSATILQSHPLIPDEVILKCVRQQVFEPAHLPGGTAVPYPFRRRFVFRPQSV
jgi:outer membrane biosynthesis protein TonB